MKLNHVLSALERLLGSFSIKNYILTTNINKNELHVYLELTKKLDSRNSEFFNLYVLKSSKFNPEILISSDFLIKNSLDKNLYNIYPFCLNSLNFYKDIINYLCNINPIKTNLNFLSNSPLILNINKDNNFDSNINTVSSDTSIIPYPTRMLQLAEKGLIEEAMDLFEKSDPAQYLNKHVSMEKSLNAIYAKRSASYCEFLLKDFVELKELNEAIDKAYNAKMTFALIGPSGCGKTQFLKAYIIHNLKKNLCTVGNFDSLRDFNVKNNAILFDDCNFCYIDSREDLIHKLDCENETCHNIKHGSKRISRNTARFITSNRSIYTYFDKSDDRNANSKSKHFAEYRNTKEITRRLVEYILPEGFSLIKR